MSNDSIGDRMKGYENRETGNTIMPRIPYYARLDGRGFSRFTNGLKRPYDESLVQTMIAVTKDLVKEFHATVGYTQSDEISIGWKADDVNTQPMFGGKVFKFTSVMASFAATSFIKHMRVFFGDQFEEYFTKMPHFDCRFMSIPNEDELVNMFLWRELDATKNAVSMAAQHYFSHKSLQGMNSSQMQERLFQEVGINFNDYPAFFKRGTYVKRQTYQEPLDDETMMSIPADKRPEGPIMVTRSRMESITMPPLLRVTNRVDALLHGAEPKQETLN